MGWMETCAVDERMRFVMSVVQREEAFAVTCRRFGVSRKTGYKWLERYREAGVEVAKRFKAGVVLPFAGAAQTRGPFHLTIDTNDTIETARAFPDAVIVPVHTDGWAHFRQSASDLRASFDTLGFGARLRILEPGVATVIEPSSRA